MIANTELVASVTLATAYNPRANNALVIAYASAFVHSATVPMARKIATPRWRKRLELPVATQGAGGSSLSTPHILRAIPKRSIFLYGIAASFIVLVALSVVLSSLAYTNASVGLVVSRNVIVDPLTRFRDSHVVEAADRAVRELLVDDWDRIDPILHSDDIRNMNTLVNVAHIPPVFASRLGVHGRRKLLRRLTMETNGIAVHSTLPQVVIIDVQNGLGNRLRALGSVMEFAFYTRRVLVILWAADAHLNGTMSDLFDKKVLDNLIIINEAVSWPIHPGDMSASVPANFTAPRADHPSMSSFKYYNLMGKDREFVSERTGPVDHLINKHIYIKSAYVIDSRWVLDAITNAFIQALTPSPAVRELVRSVEEAYGGPDALAKMIGVHIRSRSVIEDNSAIDYECEYSVFGAAVTDKWRKMSTLKQFIPEMRSTRAQWPQIVAESYQLDVARPWSAVQSIAKANSDINAQQLVSVDVSMPPRFFVSSDSVETIKRLRSAFETDDIVTLPRNCDDRGSTCILYAFADMILLSRTGAMLGSGWSSFSEAVARLRVRPRGFSPKRKDGYSFRMSGADFGGPTIREKIEAAILKLLRLGKAAKAEPDDKVSQENRRQLCRERHKQTIG